MKLIKKRIPFAFMIFLVLSIFYGFRACYAQIVAKQTAPVFSLKDLKGEKYNLEKMQDQQMIILYFFDIESRPSQEGLLILNDLAKRYQDTKLIVWAITQTSKEKADDFISRSNLVFPLLLDDSEVINLYQDNPVFPILPKVCTIGPGLKVLDCFQGGGKATEIMLVRVAERELQQRHTQFAKAISDEVVKKNPENLKAKTVKGYAELKEGNLAEAGENFNDVSKMGNEGEVLGKEGLAATYAQKGESDKALKLANEIERKAPERVYAHVIKGDILYAQGKKEEAEAAYQEATRKKEADIYQKPVAYYKRGRLYSQEGNYGKARELYDQTIEIDPYYIEATTDKGITYEKEGNWDDALKFYRQAMSIDKNDTFAVVLAKRAQEMIELQKDIERKKRIDLLVKDLAERFRKQKEQKIKEKDDWTSRPMVLSFIDFQETGGLSERDGFSIVLTTQLADLLNSSGRVQVVERVLLERLLEELNIGSSELADPETALRLGKVLAAKLISTGQLFHMPNATLLSLRIIDTETSGIAKVMTKQFGSQALLKKELFGLNRELLKTIISNYPLRGYIIETKGDQAVLNLGSNHGVVMGTKFDVIEEQKPIKFKGKLLTKSPKTIARVEVIQVEPDLCYARILEQKRSLKTEDKVQEKIEDIVLGANDDE